MPALGSGQAGEIGGHVHGEPAHPDAGVRGGHARAVHRHGDHHRPRHPARPHDAVGPEQGGATARRSTTSASAVARPSPSIDRWAHPGISAEPAAPRVRRLRTTPEELPVTLTLPRAANDVVGRAEIQHTLAAALDAAVDGRAATLVVEGEAGSGKTLLMQWLMEHAAERGCADRGGPARRGRGPAAAGRDDRRAAAAAGLGAAAAARAARRAGGGGGRRRRGVDRPAAPGRGDPRAPGHRRRGHPGAAGGRRRALGRPDVGPRAELRAAPPARRPRPRGARAAADGGAAHRRALGAPGAAGAHRARHRCADRGADGRHAAARRGRAHPRRDARQPAGREPPGRAPARGRARRGQPAPDHPAAAGGGPSDVRRARPRVARGHPQRADRRRGGGLGGGPHRPVRVAGRAVWTWPTSARPRRRG